MRHIIHITHEFAHLIKRQNETIELIDKISCNLLPAKPEILCDVIFNIIDRFVVAIPLADNTNTRVFVSDLGCELTGSH